MPPGPSASNTFIDSSLTIKRWFGLVPSLENSTVASELGGTLEVREGLDGALLVDPRVLLATAAG